MAVARKPGAWGEILLSKQIWRRRVKCMPSASVLDYISPGKDGRKAGKVTSTQLTERRGKQSTSTQNISSRNPHRSARNLLLAAKHGKVEQKTARVISSDLACASNGNSGARKGKKKL